jgi:hypothetical protein
VRFVPRACGIAAGRMNAFGYNRRGTCITARSLPSQVTRVMPDTAEHRRLVEPSPGPVPAWRKWGCYVSDRAWGTVREDYSANGDAWNFITHEKARSKAYRWGEDAIAGICDRYQLLVFAPAFWNGRDPILKERFFGLSASEGNRGADVKEYYFYLDNTPTHSYMRMLYKYPQAEFPYARLIAENRSRGGGAEFELLDTGVFDDDRYFDIVIEYAKAGAEDICIRIEAFNRGPDDAELHVLPHLWFRNTWSWSPERGEEPKISASSNGTGDGSGAAVVIVADDRTANSLPNLPFEYRLGARRLYGPPHGTPLFTNNETNGPAVWGTGAGSASPYTKDAFHRHIVNGEPDAVNPAGVGTKAAIHYRAMVPAGGSTVWRFRLTAAELRAALDDVDATVDNRRLDADEFYTAVHPPKASEDERLVQRQALAGLLWTKGIYLFDAGEWLDGDDPASPPPAGRRAIRNSHWRHLSSMRILSLADKWKSPWFSAWDLAFQSVAMALVDPAFAKDNLSLLLAEQVQHPNGQLPASEWEFSAVSPPVHAWACWRVYSLEKARTGRCDREFLERAFHKLLVNFAWWVNQTDGRGMNVLEGGGPGLDYVSAIERGDPLPGGAVLERSDAAAWMAFFCLGMMRVALELARENRAYEAMAAKFFEHFAEIDGALKSRSREGGQGWDEEDGFFYDALRYPDGAVRKFDLRSFAGLIPLYAVDVIDEEEVSGLPVFLSGVKWLIRNRADVAGQACFTDRMHGRTRHVLATVDGDQLEKVLRRVWDPAEFLSVGGIRSLSKYHGEHPFAFGGGSVRYEPAGAGAPINGRSGRGPVWFPTSFLLIESLGRFDLAHRSAMKVDAPGSKTPMTPGHMARDIADRMIGLFTRDATGRRKIHGGAERVQHDPHWRDLLLFNEYFDGDTGAGLGASHQTGSTGLVASLIDEWRR